MLDCSRYMTCVTQLIAGKTCSSSLTPAMFSSLFSTLCIFCSSCKVKIITLIKCGGNFVTHATDFPVHRSFVIITAKYRLKCDILNQFASLLIDSVHVYYVYMCV